MILWIQLATSSLKRNNRNWGHSSYVCTWSNVSYKMRFLIRDSIYSLGSSGSWSIPRGYTRAIDLPPKMWTQHCHRVWITKGCWMLRCCCTDEILTAVCRTHLITVQHCYFIHVMDQTSTVFLHYPINIHKQNVISFMIKIII